MSTVRCFYIYRSFFVRLYISQALPVLTNDFNHELTRPEKCMSRLVLLGNFSIHRWATWAKEKESYIVSLLFASCLFSPSDSEMRLGSVMYSITNHRQTNISVYRYKLRILCVFIHWTVILFFILAWPLKIVYWFNVDRCSLKREAFVTGLELLKTYV